MQFFFKTQATLSYDAVNLRLRCTIREAFDAFNESINVLIGSIGQTNVTQGQGERFAGNAHTVER